MSREPGYVTLVRQSFEGVAVPESGEAISEEVRLRAAFIGAYEYVMTEQPKYDFSAAIFYNGAVPDPARSGEQKNFEVTEDTTELERILTIQSTPGGVSLEPVEIIPVDWAGQPVDFTVVEVSKTRRIVTYKDDPAAPALRIRISGVNVGEVESANACVWARGSERGVRFAEAQAAFIERAGAIRIDMLGKPPGEARHLEAHLQALLGIIFDEAARRSLTLECRYRYQVRDGGSEVEVPVVGRVHLDSENYKEGISTLAFAIKRWRKDYSPKRGTFVFGIRVHSAAALAPALVLHLRNLLLPSESIANVE